MSAKILLVVAEPEVAKDLEASLASSPHDSFEVAWVRCCRDADQRLRSEAGKAIAAIVLDLFLPDSQGIDTFDTLLRASSGTPILILSRSHDENLARLAIERGAQDYVLIEHLQAAALSNSLSKLLRRSEYARAGLGALERAQVTLDSIGDGVISTDIAGNVTFLNAVAESMTGWSHQEATGRQLQQVLQIIDRDTRRPALDPLALAMVRNKAVGLSANSILVRRDGHEAAIEDTAAPIHDSRGKVTGAVIVFHDVGAARSMSVRMSYLAQHDFLTGLPNRMLLNDRLTQAMAFAHRHRTALAILFVDVDDFKRINDTRGHAVGDQLLKSISERLLTCVRTSDTVSRQGGDEFVVLLSEVSRSADAALSANKILTALRAPHSIEDQDVHVTVSIGIGVYPDDGTDAETLLRNADSALFEAKEDGRGKHRLFEPNMGVRTLKRRSAR